MTNPGVMDSDSGFQRLAEKITRETSFRCTSYKDKCLRRRIAVRMRAKGAETYAEYAHVLDTDAREYPKLLDALTINVTKFFRNWTTFSYVARHVIPAIWAKSGPVRIWSAGCASGEEPYSLATLIYQHALEINDLHRLSRVTVIGTDIDRASLMAAERAVYAEPAFVETPPEMTEQYFPRVGDHRTVLPEVRSLVRFEERDLLCQPAPPGIFDLVICRNVVIYFERVAQEDVFLQFYHALAPRGYLVLGRAETLLGGPRIWFRPIDLRERIFQRPA